MPFPQHCRTVLIFILSILLSLKSTALQLAFKQSRSMQRPAILSSPDSNATYLNITALTAAATPPHRPQLTCLRTPTPFTTYPTAGSSVPLSLPLSSERNMTFVTLPSRSSEGWHNPPMPMWFVLLRGKAVVTTYDPTTEPGDESWPPPQSFEDQTTAEIRPKARKERLATSTNSAEEANKSHDDSPRQKVIIEVGSPNQFLLALDLLGRGHWTDYPSDEETWALQIPLADGWEEEIRKWELVHDGACT